MLPDNAVIAHLRHLELRGHTDASVYARWRALTRLAAWLSAHEEVMPDETTAPAEMHMPGVPESGHVTRAAGRALTAEGTARRQPGRVSSARPAAPSLLTATAADLAAWRESLTTGPAATVNSVSHAREFYVWAVEHGLRPDNPAAGLPVPRLPRRLPRPVSEPDLMAALAAADARVRPWLVLAGWAGFRAREIALLRRENVLDTHVPPQLLVAADAGKGRRERLVPMCAFVLAELYAAGLPARGWVFPRHDGRPGPNAPHLVSQLANQVLHESGTGATLHQLRHRYATQFYRQSGGDLRTVQEVLGHSSPATTSGYADWDRAAAAEVAESLPVPGLRVVRRRESVW